MYVALENVSFSMHSWLFPSAGVREEKERIIAAQADAMGLKGDIRRGLGTVSAAASSASINVAHLAELDLAKSRMEAACSTLQVCSLNPLPPILRHIFLLAKQISQLLVAAPLL